MQLYLTNDILNLHSYNVVKICQSKGLKMISKGQEKLFGFKTISKVALPITTANFKMGEELYLTSDISYLLSPRSTNVSKMKGLKMLSRGPENEVRLTSAILSITNLILIDTVMY